MAVRNPAAAAAMKARGAQLRQAWLDANPGKTSKDYSTYVRGNIKAKADAARAKKAGSVSAPAKATRAPGEALARIKAMADEGFARYQAKNPGATRADYRAYSSARVKDMAARAKSKKRGGM